MGRFKERDFRMDVRGIDGETLKNKFNSLLFVISIFGIAAGILLQIPFVQNLIIAVAGKYIAYWSLTTDVWRQGLSSWSIVLFVLSFVLILAALNKIQALWDKIYRLCERYKILNWALYLLPILFGFLLITIFGVNVASWDDWGIIVLFIDDVLKNGITFAKFWEGWTDHIIFFPKIIFFIVGVISHVNTKVFIFITWIMTSAIYLMIYLYVKQTNPDETFTGKQNAVAVLLLTGFCCFNTVQWENLLWSSSIAFVTATCFIVFTFYLFNRWYATKKTVYFICSIAQGIIASFSSAMGLFALPVLLCIIALLFFTGKKIRLRYVISILIVCAATFILCAGNRTDWINKIDIMDGAASLARALVFFLAALGSPLLPAEKELLGISSLIPAVLAGFAVTIAWISLIIYLILKRKITHHVFPLALVLFGIIFCFSIALGRSSENMVNGHNISTPGLGNWRILSMALSSHYTGFSFLTIIGLVIIAWIEFIAGKGGKVGRKITITALSIVALLVLIENTDLYVLKHFADDRREVQGYIRTYMEQPLKNLSRSLFWQDLESARRDIGILEKRRWSVFAE
jgi:hypothetical protein